MVVAAVIIITVRVMVVAVAVIVTAAVVMAPGKGSGKNPEKSSPWKKRGLPLGLLTQKETRVRVINTPLNISPAQEK